MSSPYSQHPQEQLSIREIPKFEFQLHNDQLVNCIKQLTFNMKNQEKTIQKLKKDIQARPTQSQITQALAFINSVIQMDPNISKQLKSKNPKKPQQSSNPITSSSSQLGKKLNQLSQSISILHNSIKNLDKKVSDLQVSSKSLLNQKTNQLQEQIDQYHTQNMQEFREHLEKIQVIQAKFGDQVREVQTKTLWQINDCRMRLNLCISEQYVKDSMKEVEGKMVTRMKEQLIRQGSIDPQRITKIQQNLLKTQKQFSSQLTQTSYRIQNLKDTTQKTCLLKREFGQQKIEQQKRFSLLNSNIADAIRRIRTTQSDIIQEKEKIKKLHDYSEFNTKEISRMNSVLNNLKIGDDFQKMLEKMDPHKICQLDTRIQDLELSFQKLGKSLDLSKKEVDHLRSKTEFCNILTPSTGPTQKLTKQDIQSQIHDYMSSNLFTKKLQNLQSQFFQLKSYPQVLNNINKSIARLQKQSDTHNLVYQLRGLQEYVKKEILIVNNRINGIQMMFNEERKKRPHSAAKGTDQKSSSVSFKKLTPVNCISCFPADTLSSTNLRNITINRKL